MAEKTPSDIRELSSAIDELNEATARQYEQELRAAEAANQHAAAMGEAATRADHMRQASDRNIKLGEERLKQLQQEDEALKKNAENLRKKIQAGDDVNGSLQSQLDLNDKLLKMGPAQRKAEADQIKAMQRLNDQRKKRIGLAEKFAENAGRAAGVTNDWKEKTAGLVFQMVQLDTSLGEVTAAMAAQFSIQNILGSALQTVIDQTRLLFVELDAATASFRKATAAGHEYDIVIANLETSLRSYGFSAAEASASLKALYTEYAGFTRLSKQEQENLARTTTHLTRFGVSAAEASKAAGFLGDALGKTGPQIEETQRNLIALARDLKIPPGVIFSEFNAASGELAKYGDQMEHVFKRLAAQSKSTGLSISQLINVSKGFDTFETAAAQAQRLNAVLGGPYLDTVALIGMNEAERNAYIKEQIKLTGLNIESLNRAEAQMVATALGFSNVGDAMKFLRGDELEELEDKALNAAYSEEELADASREALGLLEKLDAIVKGFAVSLAPLLKPLNAVATYILELQEKMGNWFGIIVAGIATIGLFIIALKLLDDEGGGAAKGFTDKLSDGVASGVKKIMDGARDGVNGFKDAASEGIDTFLKFGVAILAIGAGVALFGAGVLATGFGVIKLCEGLKCILDMIKENLEVFPKIRKEIVLFGEALTAEGAAKIAATGGAFLLLAQGMNSVTAAIIALPVTKLADFIGLTQVLRGQAVDPFVIAISSAKEAKATPSAAGPTPGTGGGATTAALSLRETEVATVKSPLEAPGGLLDTIKDAIVSGFSEGNSAAAAAGGTRNIELKLDRHTLGRVLDKHFDKKVGLK
jgi:hypothetical protein